MNNISRRLRIKNNLIESRNNILEGRVNCIPLPFHRFRSEFPGIRRKFYYLVSGGTKSSKTQITNYIFVINSIFYYLNYPDRVKPTIHIFPLEETEDDITLRFYAYVINYISKGKYSLSPEELESVDERNPLNQEVLDLMDSEEFIKITNTFDECVHFHSNQRNPTGIYKTIKQYMEDNGEVEYRKEEITYKDDFGVVKKETINKIVGYKPNNPNEYVIFIVDHVGLLQIEQNMTLKATIEKLSEYCVILRNKYSAIPVIVQQQNSETTNLDAFKSNKVRPTKDGLKDSKRTGEDCTVLLGITNPYSFDLPTYLGYDITKLKDSFRVLEVVLSRKGKANGLCPLYFNGAINLYSELPLPNDSEKMNKVYKVLQDMRNKTNKVFFIHNSNNNKKELQRKNIFSKFAALFNNLNKRK